MSSFLTDLGAAIKAKLDLKANSSDLANKVDKVAGKGLSTEDYTTAEKSKLAAVPTSGILSSSDIGTTVQGYDATTLKSSSIGVTVQGYDANTVKAGTTINGALKEKSVAMAASAVDLTLGNVFTKTISGATTITISGAVASPAVNSFSLVLTNGGSAVISWFSGVKWIGGVAPTLTAAGVDIISFESLDGGTTWRQTGIAKDVK